jgi:hypothetical protein
MSQPTWRYGLAALLAAWSIDLLFWKTPPGVSFFVWTVFVIAAGLLLGRADGVRFSRWSILPIVSSLIFSGITFIRAESFTRFSSYLLTLASLALLAGTLSSGNWIVYRLWDYLSAFLRLLLGVLIRPFDLLRRPAGAQTRQNTQNSISLRSTARRVGVGLLLALPVVGLLASLLASADPIFADRLGGLFKIFDLNKVGETIFRLTYILIFAFIFTGVYLHALRPTSPETRPNPASPWLKPFLGWTESAVVLVCVDLLFGLFVGIQFWYFFGGEANITATGYTYADYARRGFFELVAVAVISLMLYLCLSTITRRDSRASRTGFTGLSVFLMAMVVVMLVSAFQRLLLYEQAYGFTHMRLYTHIFIIWLGALLLATVIFELARRSYRFGLALLVTILGFGLTFGLLNVDATIAGQNLERARTGAKLDAIYLASLSPDGVPMLLDEFRRAGQTQAIRDALGAELACRTASVRKEILPWQGLNLSENNARTLLLANQAEWAAYPVRSTKSSGTQFSVMINGSEQPCNIRSFMD